MTMEILKNLAEENEGNIIYCHEWLEPLFPLTTVNDDTIKVALDYFIDKYGKIKNAERVQAETTSIRCK